MRNGHEFLFGMQPVRIDAEHFSNNPSIEDGPHDFRSALLE